MRQIRKAYCLIILSCLAPAVVAHAQGLPEDRVQVRISGGWAGFSSQLIGHSAVGGTLDVRVARGFRAGAEAFYYDGPADDRDVSAIAIVGYDFLRSRRIAPFVSGGVGVLRHRIGNFRGDNLSFGVSTGLKISLSDRVFIAPEFRLGYEPALRSVISVGYRF